MSATLLERMILMLAPAIAVWDIVHENWFDLTLLTVLFFWTAFEVYKRNKAMIYDWRGDTGGH